MPVYGSIEDTKSESGIKLPFKIIESQDEYKVYLKRCSELIKLQPKKGTEECNELELLSLIVSHYEDTIVGHSAYVGKHCIYDGSIALIVDHENGYKGNHKEDSYKIKNRLGTKWVLCSSVKMYNK